MQPQRLSGPQCCCGCMTAELHQSFQNDVLSGLYFIQGNQRDPTGVTESLIWIVGPVAPSQLVMCNWTQCRPSIDGYLPNHNPKKPKHFCVKFKFVCPRHIIPCRYFRF
ncbi:hypothetical protein TNCT_437771 [Trichonephila clavata]|uniref:Uncharacterized protein n=1 Tax=Trichonephila clavata TaxID=2740835 RepID=A0A8X6JC18_TRICU|nr:hypothetical protein TNCT_437771 [Trichonephila clavata]